MRDSVPSARYSPVCNVLRLWRISLIPTYRVYRLYDKYVLLSHLLMRSCSMVSPLEPLCCSRTAVLSSNAAPCGLFDVHHLNVYKLYISCYIYTIVSVLQLYVALTLWKVIYTHGIRK